MSREEKLRTILKTIDMSEYSDTKKNIDIINHSSL